MDAVSEYSLKKMTGCISGKVPHISPDLLPALITHQYPVKILLEDSAVHYGYVHSYNPRAHSYTFRVLTTEGSHILYNLNSHTTRLFSALPLESTIPRDLGCAIIIKQELFTVVFNHAFYPIWLGDGNLVYYSEDIQALIQMHHDYTILG